SDDGMDQAGSGVADECTCSSGAELASIFRSLGIDESDGLSLVSVVEEEEVVEMIQKRQRILKFQIDLQPNQLGVGQSDHGPLTSLELCTTSCDLYEIRRIWFPTCGGE
ncbi:hypothetical protein Tco_1239464, partial [Tanacetum coccineum]